MMRGTFGATSLLLSAIFAAAAAAAAAAMAGEAQPATSGKGEKLAVFILAGQSNMAGAGKVEELPQELKGELKDVLIVRFWETQFRPLDPVKGGKEFGPEVAFGLEMSKALKRPVALVKLAEGGTSLEQHWNPSSDDKRGLYKRLTDYVASVRGKNKDIEIMGMIWMQGEADAKYHSKTVEQYRGKFEALIDGCRKEFSVESMPFVCGRVNPSGAQYLKQVREAQETIKRPQYAWFDCDDLDKHDDKLHYNTKGQLELGRRFAKAMLTLMEESARKSGAQAGEKK